MKRYLLHRKWLCLLTLAAVALFNLINAERTVLEQNLIDTVLALESDNILSMMLLVIGMSVFSGVSYVAAQLLKNALSVTVVDDMRKSIFTGISKRSRKDFFSVNYSDYISAITNDLKLIRGQYMGCLLYTSPSTRD